MIAPRGQPPAAVVGWQAPAPLVPAVAAAGAHRLRGPPPAASGLLGPLSILLKSVPPSPPVASWLPWRILGPPPSESAAERKARRQQERQQRLRLHLAQSRLQPPLLLPTPPEVGPKGEDNSTALAAAASVLADPWCAASNAVPFAVAPYGGAPGSGGVPAPSCTRLMPPAEQVQQALPWLYVAGGRLDLAAAEHMATALALASLHQLDTSVYAEGRTNALPSGLCWAGPQPFPSPAVAAAAALRRMESRIGGALQDLPEREGHVIVLVHKPEHRGLAAEALALYLHLYHSLPLREAAQAAGHALGASPLLSTLRATILELAECASSWNQRWTLGWAYTGGQVDVVGEAVGGWDRRMPLRFSVEQRQWRVQLWGLPPGAYRYKFIVDGTWCVDLAAPHEQDSYGNCNNVLVVPAPGEEPAAEPATPGASSSSAAAAGGGSGSGGATPPGSSARAGGGATTGPSVLASNWEAAETATQLRFPTSPAAQVESATANLSQEEREHLAKLCAALLSLHMRLPVQRRHVMN